MPPIMTPVINSFIIKMNRIISLWSIKSELEKSQAKCLCPIGLLERKWNVKQKKENGPPRWDRPEKRFVEPTQTISCVAWGWEADLSPPGSDDAAEGWAEGLSTEKDVDVCTVGSWQAVPASRSEAFLVSSRWVRGGWGERKDRLMARSFGFHSALS